MKTVNLLSEAELRQRNEFVKKHFSKIVEVWLENKDKKHGYVVVFCKKDYTLGKLFFLDRRTNSYHYKRLKGEGKNTALVLFVWEDRDTQLRAKLPYYLEIDYEKSGISLN
jgi:hypothetical protein